VGRGHADLHIHTSASDGCLSPAEVVALAAREGFAAIAICDHDTVAGIPEAIAAAEEVGLELIPGIELAADLGKNEVHILGYCFDYRSPSLAAVTRRLCEERRKRIKKMIRLLRDLGVPLDTSGIDHAATFGSVGRMHVARALVEQQFVSDLGEAFSRYIGRGKPAYVSRAHLSPAEACALIAQAHGVPVLAHPSVLDNDTLIPRLVKDGIMGIEAFYPSRGPDRGDSPPNRACKTVRPELAEHYCRLAQKWGLLVTGGSDCHQSEEGNFLIGTVRLDYSYVEKLKQKAAAGR
jgi:hypothetical protein